MPVNTKPKPRLNLVDKDDTKEPDNDAICNDMFILCYVYVTLTRDFFKLTPT